MTYQQRLYHPCQTVADAESIVAAIEDRPKPENQFSPTRWPYTYAYDYMKSHDILGAAAHGSRSECAGLLRYAPDKERIVRILALAYCREWDIRIPLDFDTDA